VPRPQRARRQRGRQRQRCGQALRARAHLHARRRRHACKACGYSDIITMQSLQGIRAAARSVRPSRRGVSLRCWLREARQAWLRCVRRSGHARPPARSARLHSWHPWASLAAARARASGGVCRGARASEATRAAPSVRCGAAAVAAGGAPAPPAAGPAAPAAAGAATAGAPRGVWGAPSAAAAGRQVILSAGGPADKR